MSCAIRTFFVMFFLFLFRADDEISELWHVQILRIYLFIFYFKVVLFIYSLVLKERKTKTI
jgi:hypothetical protein